MKLEKIISLLMTLVMSMCTTACDAKEDINMVLNETAPTEKTFFATDDYVKQLGRNVYDEDTNVLWLAHTAACIEFEVNGTELAINLVSDNSAFGDNKARYAIYLDGELFADEMMNAPEKTVEIFEHEEAQKHTVKLIKLSECNQSIFGIQSIVANCINNITPTAYKDLKIEFIGDSITCGYGVDDEVKEHHFSTSTEDGTKTYAYKACEALGADYSMVCYSGHGIISGYTSDGQKSGGLVPEMYHLVGNCWSSSDPNLSQIEWDFDKFEPDYVVINLGTNDHSYVKGDAAKAKEYAEAYAEFIKVIRKKYKDTHIICSLGIMGDELFKSIEEAIELSGDKNISALRFSPRASTDPVAADWHPAEATHERAAGELVEHINSLKK